MRARSGRNRARWHALRLLVVLFAALLVAACASTTQRKLATDSGAGGAPGPAVSAGNGAETHVEGGGDTAAGAATSDASASGAGGAAGGGSTASGGGPAGGASATPGAGAAAGGAHSADTGASAAAVSGTLRIGLHLSKDLQAAYAAFGAKGAEGDLMPVVRKVVDWINANGGMGGHRVEPIFHESDPLNGTFDAEGQATCSEFADDQHVFAVVSGAVLPTIVTVDCLVKKHVPIVWNYHYLVDGPMWRQYEPYLYMPFSVNADRMGFYVDALASHGYFDAGARVGVVRYDLPQHARLAANVLRPRFAAHHVNVVDEIAIRPPDSAAAAADTGAQVSSAILRLRAEQVTHVVFVPTGGVVPFVFMSEAEGQGFHPRYAMNTLDVPYFVSDQAPGSQLHGATVVGWSPPSDVHREQAPAINDASARCYQLTNSQGAQRYCDGLFFLKAALDRASTLDAAGLRAAVEAMGDNGFAPTFSFATRFGPGRHDGARAARVATYDDGCGCFRYTSALFDIG